MNRLGVLTFGIALLAATAASAQSTVPLGDVARQTAEKRATAKKAKRVFTNADLTSDPRDPAPAAAAEPAAVPAAAGAGQSAGNAVPAPEKAPASKEAAAKDSASADEMYWRNRTSRLRKNINETREAIAAYEQSPQPALQRKYESDKKMLVTYQRQLDEHLQSAKQANVPQAWLEPK